MRDFCRAMLCISAAYAVMRCLCVCLCVCLCARHVREFCRNDKKHIFKCFTPSGSQAILVFWYQTVWQYSDGNPLTGASNACGVGRNRDSEPISGLTAYVVKRSSGKCSKLGCDEPCQVYNTSRWWAAEFVDGSMAGNNDEVYDKKPQRYAEDNVTQQWLIWNLTNNNKRLRTSYFVEANYWRTQSIARLLCNSRATGSSVLVNIVLF